MLQSAKSKLNVDADSKKEGQKSKGGSPQSANQKQKEPKKVGIQEEPLQPIKEETEDYDVVLYHTSPHTFKPRLYNFKQPVVKNPNDTFNVLSPPFWLMVDHLVAVVWYIYSGERKGKLETLHLQWALEFVRWIKDEKGEYSPVIKSLLEVLEHAVFEKVEEELGNKTNTDEPENESPESYPKEDLITSVTLNDILSRTSGVAPEKVSSYHPGPMKSPLATSSMKTSMAVIFDNTAKDLMPDKVNENEDLNCDKLLKFLRQLKTSQLEKVNKESERLQELDGAIAALREGKAKFGEWLKRNYS